MALLKNTTINDTGFLQIPTGTTAERPTNPVEGDFRFNTSKGYLEYYYKGFWINGEINKGGIPMEGLIFLADVDNPNSWNGTTLTDIAGNTTITLSGSISQGTTSSGSKFLFGGTSAFITIPLNVSSLTGNVYTVMTVSAYNGSTRSRITSTNSNNWLLGHWSAGDVRYFAEGWITEQISSGSAILEWGVHVGTGDSKVDEWQYWKNGGQQSGNLSGGTNGPTSLQINGWGASERSDWRWQFLAVWNRVLGQEEIVELTSSIRERGGF